MESEQQILTKSRKRHARGAECGRGGRPAAQQPRRRIRPEEARADTSAGAVPTRRVRKREWTEGIGESGAPQSLSSFCRAVICAGSSLTVPAPPPSAPVATASPFGASSPVDASAEEEGAATAEPASADSGISLYSTSALQKPGTTFIRIKDEVAQVMGRSGGVGGWRTKLLQLKHPHHSCEADWAEESDPAPRRARTGW